MIKLVVGACVGLLLCGNIAAEGLEKIKEKGALRVALYKDFPPYSFADATQKMRGVDLDIARALAAKLGVGMNLMAVTAGESMADDLRNSVWKGHYLGGGVADVMLHVPVDARFAEDNPKVKIFAPYYQEQVTLAYNPKRIPNLPSLQVLLDHKVGVELSSVASVFLTSTMQGLLRNSVQHYPKFVEALAAFQKGEVSAVMGQRGQIESGLDKDQPVIYSESPMPGLIQKWTVGLAVKADNPELVTELEQAMKALQKDGTLAKIFAEYHISYAAVEEVKP
jgi:ABC-type amino acid transport substrate-binding protein